MRKTSSIRILPYTRVIGQEKLKLVLELAFIAPKIGGVLISGERGTGKSTTVRAFSQMMYGDLPVTIPINATEDRVVGGWEIDKLMRGEPIEQIGLLEEANGRLLYIDEVNLLDDHIVNIILDVTSTGVLTVQREGLHGEPKQLQFTLVGTMNPEEGSLRPQLLDRFGLMVQVAAETDEEKRGKILQMVLTFDKVMTHRGDAHSETFFEEAYQEAKQYKAKLVRVRQDFYNVEVPKSMLKSCVTLAKGFRAEGHRADYLLVLAAQALAALQGQKAVEIEHIKMVAPLVLQHRLSGAIQLNRELWGKEEENRIKEYLNHV